MIKTSWNTDLYNPQPAAFVSTGLHFKRGEIYAHVYCCLLAGMDTARAIARKIQRVDQRVYDALSALEAHGYATKETNPKGRGHEHLWKVTE